ncbi:DinB superfamily protein [Zobellia uliginosa]|uniref:DinB superfamily protein n=2 Tax=Zobellia uliginosa TaxID=143224 RepID=A0ABY1KRG7_9FLAO|nr:DinB superfamily protein [Zobellia uliginosa]
MVELPGNFYLYPMRTTDIVLPKPAPFYKAYIDVLGDVELLGMLERQLDNFPKFIESIPDDKMSYAYGPDKWTTAQVLLHIIDSERVFQYRALRFSRGDQTSLPGFDQDLYVLNSEVEKRSKESIIKEYRTVREATISLYRSFDPSILGREGLASSLPWSVALLGFVICGHQKHHRNILRERYLP